MPRENKGWFKNLIKDIKNKVESVDETLVFFNLHADRWYKKFDEIREVSEVISANMEY